MVYAFPFVLHWNFAQISRRRSVVPLFTRFLSCARRHIHVFDMYQGWLEVIMFRTPVAALGWFTQWFDETLLISWRSWCIKSCVCITVLRSATRGDIEKLTAALMCTETGIKSFSIRVAHLWNSLPAEVRNLPSFIRFKTTLRGHCIIVISVSSHLHGIYLNIMYLLVGVVSLSVK